MLTRRPVLIAGLAVAVPALALAAAPLPPDGERGSGGAIEKPPCRFERAIHFTPCEMRTIDRIVLHTVEGSATGCVRWFQSQQSQVSAHYVISHEGEIIQMVDDNDIAWHAGDRAMNARSIGIEHEGYAQQDTWTDEQVRASAALARWICDTYGFPADREHVVAHAEVTPGRRTDPGPYFPWDRWLALANEPAGTPAEPERIGPVSDAERLAQARADAARLLERALADDGRGRFDAADRAFRRIVRRCPDSREAERAAEHLARYASDPAIAAQIERQRAEAEARRWAELAQGYLQNEHPDRARELYARLVAVYPDAREASLARRRLDELPETPAEEH